jgi:hypothetical protein
MTRLLRFSMFILIAGLALITAGNASATTYYISTSGSDSNASTQAQSKSTPWAHLPGMANASAAAASYTPVAGDTFILRGCDSWLNSSFPIAWPWSGSSGNLITVTVDKSWYNTGACPSGWNRPIFDAQSAVISSAGSECGGPVHNAFLLDSGSYNLFAWIEVRDMYWAGSCENSYIVYDTGANNTIDNWYAHNWTQAGGNDNPQMFGAPLGACGQNSTVNCTVSNTVINNCDGSAKTGVQTGGFVGGMNSIGNIFVCLTNALKTWGNGTLAYNNVSRIAEHPPSGAHPNCLETIGDSGTGIFYIHDNYINETSGGGCEGGQVGNPGETDFVWNNVWYMTGSGANQPQVPQSDGPNWSLYFWNNTAYVAAGCISTGVHGTSIHNFYAENNHCINNNGLTINAERAQGNAALVPTGASAQSNNLNMTTSTAASQGYTASNKFAPTSANNATVGAGTSLLTSLTTWLAQIIGTNTASLLTSASVGSNGACTQQTVSGVVESVCPASNTSRGSTPDVGAYQWGSAATVSAPNPPTGLLASVQ